MAGKSDYLENYQLDQIYGNLSFAANLYLALFSVSPGDAGGGTEIVGNNYGRIIIVNDTTSFPAAAAGQKKNGIILTSAVAGPGNWGVIPFFAMFDAPSGGNMLHYGTISPSVTILSGQQFVANINDLVISED